jgi:ribonuclease P protein component
MLQAPVVARSTHFVVHHQAQPASSPTRQRPGQVVQGFSTELNPQNPQTVDNSADMKAVMAVLGVMVPKRHAKRAVTRNLVKRLVRSVWQVQFRSYPQPQNDVAGPQGARLQGTWLVRLRQPIHRNNFPSASSDALRNTLHAELLGLLTQMQTQAQAQPARVAAP